MTNKKVMLEIETMSIAQKKDLLAELFNSLTANFDQANR